MTANTIDESATAMLDGLRDARDAMSVNRVVGDPIEVEGTTLIPVARIAGGGGGGGGEGTDGEESGGGFGTGFGLSARGLGMYEVQDGSLVWKPAVDVDRAIRGGQVLAGIAMICVALVMLRRS